MSHIDKIVQIAHSYNGFKEIPPNQGFVNSVLQKKMDEVGFYKGANWCGFQVMVVLFDAYADDQPILTLLKKYCSASTHQMYLNFKASKEFVTGMIPKIGAIAIYQEGDGTAGHTGLVIDVDKHLDWYELSEGNSNTDGSRNGSEVAENIHSAKPQPHKINGLNLLCFVYMPD